MKKTYIIIIVSLIVIVAVLLILKAVDKPKAVYEPPMEDILKNNETTPLTNTSNTERTVKEFTISGQNFSFVPNSITVKKGDKVKINFKNTEGFHNLNIDEFNVATKTISGGQEESVEFTADQTGSFQYYCAVGSHRAMGMWGTLKVE